MFEKQIWMILVFSQTIKREFSMLDQADVILKVMMIEAKIEKISPITKHKPGA